MVSTHVLVQELLYQDELGQGELCRVIELDATHSAAVVSHGRRIMRVGDSEGVPLTEATREHAVQPKRPGLVLGMRGFSRCLDGRARRSWHSVLL